MKNKKVSILGIILSIIGVFLIVFGAVVKINSTDNEEKSAIVGTYSYKKTLDAGKVLYEFEVITNETMNTAGVYMIVNKTGVVDSESFKLTLKSLPKDEKGYLFVVSLNSNDYLILSGDEISLEASNMSGQKITLTEDVFGSFEKLNKKTIDNFKSINIFVKAASIMVGAVLVITGISLISIKKRNSEVKTDGVNSLNLGGVIGTVEGNENVQLNKNQNKECGYCGSMNKPDALKCSGCGAPIRKKKN